ncbi:MAG: winged helix-turn-helix domain-containing protein [Desulfobulbaceae bacterium]|nr:winged helix-turn-helix domain-containing protein [Desulfobulbaceae bacterium]
MKTTSLFSGFITSKTRIKILMRLFLNPAYQAHLRGLADELALTPSHVRDELRQLSNAGLLKSSKNGRQVDYRANCDHPLFPELQSMVKKALGMDHILESIVIRLGKVRLALLLDDYAEGKDTGLVDLVLVGEINQDNLADLTRKAERYIERKIRTLVLSEEEYAGLIPMLAPRPQLVLWGEADGEG